MIGYRRRSGNLRPIRLGLAPAAAICIAGCASTCDPATGDLRTDLRHRDPRVRIESAVKAAGEGRVDLVPELVGNLEDRDESVRFVSGIALKRLTGRDFGFLSFASPADRADAVRRWRRWIEGAPGSVVEGDATATAAAARPGGTVPAEAAP